jgi:hypothetical protein
VGRVKSEKAHGARTMAKRSERKVRERERERIMPFNAISWAVGRAGQWKVPSPSLGEQRTDGGFRGYHDFMKLVLAWKAAPGVVVNAMIAVLL